MSGYVVVSGYCYGCNRLFTFNAHHVPSLPIDPQTKLPPDVDPQPGGYERAVRQPLCRDCVERANVERVARGEEPFPIHPEAYEPMPEAELG